VKTECGRDGVRERLREMFGRSPDSNEVLEKMEWDKGYGKIEVGSDTILTMPI